MTDLVSTRSLTIAGLPLHLYSHKNARHGPVAIFFVLHGRQGSALEDKHLARVRTLVELSYREDSKVDPVFVSFDHRNHGARLSDRVANSSWTSKQANERHAIDMYATQSGTTRDVSFLIDFLPSYLYPHNERAIVDWGVIGISLGGHSTWLALRHEPRITIGIPIIASPDYFALMEPRAERSGIALEAPYFPSALRSIVGRDDPCHCAYSSKGEENPFINKRILVLSGAADTLVPWAASEEFVGRLEAKVKDQEAYDGVGHECTHFMLERAAQFVVEQLAL